MVEPRRVAEVMGGPDVLGHQIRSLQDLSDAVSAGLPKRALRSTLEHVYEEPKQVTEMVYRVVPEATYKRRSRLSLTESERTERLARVIAMAEYVWNDSGDAQKWLITPHPELGGRAPLACAMTELGARQVEELLQKLFYGLPV